MYVFDKEIIHDQKAMWSVALNFTTFYKIWSEELEKLKKDGSSMNYDGKLIFKWHDEKAFKKAVADYKQRVKVLEIMIERDIRHSNNEYSKYITKE